MNTPAHLAFGLAAFGKPGQAGVTLAALVGAFLPDASLYAMAGWQIRVLGTPPETVFRELYYSDAWQAVFDVDNSFVVWGAVLALGIALKRAWIAALAGAALLHLALDLPLHHDDARRHFWPLTDWVFVSPVSYWDPARHGRIVGALEVGAVLACTVYVWRRFQEAWVRIVAAVLALAEFAPIVMWSLMFA